MPVNEQHFKPSSASTRRWRTYSVSGIIGLGALAGQCAAPQCAPAPPAPAPAPAGGRRPAGARPHQPAPSRERAAGAGPEPGADQRRPGPLATTRRPRRHESHAGSDGSNAGQRIERQGYRWRAWAENVAVGYPDAASVMDGWMNSPGHRENILERAASPRSASASPTPPTARRTGPQVFARRAASAQRTGCGAGQLSGGPPQVSLTPRR